MPNRPPTELQAPSRDLYQYNSDRQVPPLPLPGPVNREVPPPPLPGLLIREVPPPPLPGPVDREVQVPPHREFEDDHSGPGSSRRRRTLREQLNLPERPNPYRHRIRDRKPMTDQRHRFPLK